MKFANAFKSVTDYLETEGALDLGYDQVEKLARHIAATVLRYDAVMIPAAVAVHAEEMFGQDDEPSEISDDRAMEKIRGAALRFNWASNPTVSYVKGILGNIRDAVSKDHLNFSFDEYDSLVPFIKAAKIPLRTEISDSLLKAWGASEYSRRTGYDDLVLAEFHRENHPDETSWQTYASIIKALGQQHGWLLNSTGEEQQTLERCSKIKEKILLGRDAYSTGSARHGGSINIAGSTLNRNPGERAKDWLARLSAVKSEVDDYRAQRDMSREERRDYRRNLADVARGHRVFHAGDRTNMDIGDVRHKDSSSGGYEAVNPDQIAVGRTTSTFDRSAPAPIADSAKSLWINPSNGQYYSPTEMRALVNTNRALFKKMMNVDLNFTNRLLRGE